MDGESTARCLSTGGGENGLGDLARYSKINIIRGQPLGK